jgi:8-oxo-dGTP pyrophosphatase MutT (NUDIX family)
MRLRIYAKAAVIGPDNKVLLLTRSATDEQRPGDQDFPGGQVEPGEGLTAGVIREIKEEIGLEVPVEQARLVYAETEFYEERGLSVTRLLFIVRVAETPAIKLSFEHQAYQWRDIPAALEAFPHHFYGVGLGYAQKHDLLG